MVTLLWTYRRLSRLFTATQRQEYLQLEGLFSLFSALKINYPLPPMRDWAISPDFAAGLVSLILKEKPRRIVELGSGVSTVVAAYCLKQLGSGTLDALEHDRAFAANTVDNLINHGVKQFAHVINAPLRETNLGGKTWLWYSQDQLDLSAKIDMLSVDGPPGHIQHLSRYPALPILYEYIRQGGVVLVDDAHREDEQEMLRLWQGEFQGLVITELSTEKGAAILRKTGAAQ